jgi:hypothetical protein
MRCDACNQDRTVASRNVVIRRPVMVTCVVFACEHRQHFIGTRLAPCDCVPASEPASRPLHPHVVLTGDEE